MSSLTLSVASIFIVLALMGFAYAYIVYLKPLDKTYWEVVIGVGGKDLAEMALIGVTLWHYSLLSQLWPMLLIPLSCSAVSGLSQIYWQEKKHKEGHKRVKVKLVEHNSNNDIEESD